MFVLVLKINHSSAGTGFSSEWSSMAVGINVVTFLQLVSILVTHF
jgi:hypothetical protein